MTNLEPPKISGIDRAFARAVAAWGRGNSPDIWAVLGPGRHEELAAARDIGSVQGQAEALASLALEHRAQARPDLDRVHPSWWARALEQEPPSVRQAVAASLPDRLRSKLLTGRGPEREGATPRHVPLPMALRAAVALWSERLIGDLADRPDDPPVVRALTGPDLFSPAALVEACGATKLRLADGSGDVRAADDVAAADRARTGVEARLGVLTLARLLSVVDPYRVRWALQHVPYAYAKTLRAVMRQNPDVRPEVVAWENLVLETARAGLESQVPGPDADPTGDARE